MTIGEKIRELRKAKGITQNELAARSGIHPVTIRKYETNAVKPLLPQLKKLSDGLGVGIDELVYTALSENGEPIKQNKNGQEVSKMAIGKRIRFIRNLRGMTQKQLGIAVGYAEKTADIRMAQYENGSRKPKQHLTNEIANALGVSSEALTTPNIDSGAGVMHTLFALEDLYGFKIDVIDNEPVIRLNERRRDNEMRKMLLSWHKEAEKWRDGKSMREDYDDWRYNYPP